MRNPQRVAQKKGEYNKPVDIDVTPAPSGSLGATPDLT
jgi:hypothetical protein